MINYDAFLLILTYFFWVQQTWLRYSATAPANKRLS